MLDVENKTKWILSAIISVTLLSYIFSGFGKVQWIVWLNVIFGVLLGLLIFAEVGIVTYFRQGKYKSISLGDFLVLGGAIFGAGVILNSIFFLQTFRALAPAWLLSYLGVQGVLISVVAGFIALALIWTPKPKA